MVSLSLKHNRNHPRCSILSLAVVAFAVILDLHRPSFANAWSLPPLFPKSVGRRGALQKLVSLTTGIVTATGFESIEPSAAASDDKVPKHLASSTPFDAYHITPVEKFIRSKLDKIDSQEFLRQLANLESGSVWLGEHHNSISDHNFQATVIRDIHKKRSKHPNWKDTPMAIGLEQVQSQFQPILDDYVSGKISLEQLRFMVQWDKRWTWSFENYKEIFVAARQLSNIRLLALNVDSEDLVLVEKEGYPGLPKKTLHKYIKDPIGFAEFSTTAEFKTYNDYVIKPSYDLHRKLGLLQYTMLGEPMETEMTFGRFLSGRLLWDEGMASSAFEWCSQNPKGLLIGLVGADHVKFQNGIPGRFARMANNKGSTTECKAVIINPTLIDSRPSGTVARIPTSDSAEYPERVTLQLRYTKPAGDNASIQKNGDNSVEGVLPFSDYVVVT